jgi:hypothetical protein
VEDLPRSACQVYTPFVHAHATAARPTITEPTDPAATPAVIIAIPIKALPVLLQINGNGFCHFEVPRKRGKTPKVAPANVN